MRRWARRASELHGELAAIAEVDPRWWLLAGGAAAAEPLPARASYVFSDAEPITDTFIGHRAPAPDDPVRDAIARAHAARAALRELDGELPDQPLATTIRRGPLGARLVPSALELAAFAIGDELLVVELAADPGAEGVLAARLTAAIAHAAAPTAPAPPRPPIATASGEVTPFVCVAIGIDPLATARHGHRRAWTALDEHATAGPWLGLGRTDGLATVSTCHLAIDGYGHAWLATKIAEHHARMLERAPGSGLAVPLPPLAPVATAIPLGVAWCELAQPAPRALPLGYALGRVLHRAAGSPDARFSPTFQIPIAPGQRDDPARRRRRVVHSAISVRFEDGTPEPYEIFEARARDVLAREADGHGLVARLMAAARAAPISLAWKRRSFSAVRPRWLDRVAEVVGGRACLSRIFVEIATPPSCAVSSPARLATPTDPTGSCVVTIIDDGTRAALTVCGSGLTGSPAGARAILDELLALV